MSTMESAIEDLKDDSVPPCLYWSVDKVAEWIEKIGFPNYKVWYIQITSSNNMRKIQNFKYIELISYMYFIENF